MKWDSSGLLWDMPGVTYDNPADVPSTLNTSNTMATNPTNRIDPKTLQADIASYQAMLNITGYTPANTAYSTANGTTAYTAMTGKQTSETQAKATADAARDDATSAEWDFHNYVLGMKDQVRAQFGADSNELQAVGLKKKSEKKKPNVKKAPAAAK
jgi:hypothetical protein